MPAKAAKHATFPTHGAVMMLQTMVEKGKKLGSRATADLKDRLEEFGKEIAEQHELLAVASPPKSSVKANAARRSNASAEQDMEMEDSVQASAGASPSFSNASDSASVPAAPSAAEGSTAVQAHSGPAGSPAHSKMSQVATTLGPADQEASDAMQMTPDQSRCVGCSYFIGCLCGTDFMRPLPLWTVANEQAMNVLSISFGCVQSHIISARYKAWAQSD